MLYRVNFMKLTKTNRDVEDLCETRVFLQPR